MIAVSSCVALFSLSQIVFNPSYRIRPNLTRFGFVFVEGVPLSALGFIAEKHPADAGVFLIACSLSGTVLALALRLCPLPLAAALPRRGRPLQKRRL